MIPAIVTPYSFEGSILKIEQAIDKAYSYGLRSLLVADRNFHSAVIFNDLCRRKGLIAVHGLKIGEKIFYARNRKEFDELVDAYNKRIEPQLNSLNVDSVKLIYYLENSHREAYETMCQLLSVPSKVGSSFEGRFQDVAALFNCEMYNLQVNVKLPQPQKHWLRKFLDEVAPRYKERFKKEVEVIEKLGFESYFYTVKRIVDSAKSLGIYVGPGRGSAVGSVVSYVLGITRIDPLEYDLLFERFLNEYRQEPPDIDIDVEDEKRSLLIEKLSEQFAFVAQISTFSTLSHKLLQNELKRLRINLKSRIMDLLNGLPLHRSTHAAGIVIADSAVSLPIVPDTKPFLLEYDMESLNKIGVTKIDILGLKTLSLLYKLKNLTNLKEIPIDDPLVYKEISSGRTHGIFQLERLSARSFCRQLRPRNISELSDLLAMNRPGPLLARLNSLYAERKRGCGESNHFFEETNGVMIYQEQLMKIAIDFAGMTPAESDLFRKAVSQKDKIAMRDVAEQFRQRAIEKGYDKSLIEQIINIILKFSSYCFNKSHSIAYAHISYELAYIKHHFPKEFFTLYLKEHSNDKDKIFFSVQELRSLGFRVICPSINPVQLKDDEFQVPIEVIAGVSNSIVNACATKGPFSSIDDFARKISVPISTLQRLVFAGAFDCIYSTREESIRAFNAYQKGYDPSLIEISSIFGTHYEEKPLKLTQKDIAVFEEHAYGFPMTPMDANFEKFFAPLTEVFTCGRVLPVSVMVHSNLASDGITIVRMKSNLPDGEYLCIMKPDGSVGAYHDLSRANSVIYELEGCFDHTDFEPASEREIVRVRLLGKKVYINSARPMIDGYNIDVVYD